MPETTLDPAATDDLRSQLADEVDTRWRATFGDEKWGRLTALNRQWDPDNVFRLNVYVPPADA